MQQPTRAPLITIDELLHERDSALDLILNVLPGEGLTGLILPPDPKAQIVPYMMAASVATGRPFADRHSLRGYVTYLNARGPHMLKQFAQVLSRQYPVDSETPLLVARLPISLDEPKQLRQLIQSRKVFGKLKLLIVEAHSSSSAESLCRSDPQAFIAYVNQIRGDAPALICRLSDRLGPSKDVIQNALEMEFKVVLEEDAAILSCSTHRDGRKPEEVRLALPKLSK